MKKNKEVEEMGLWELVAGLLVCKLMIAYHQMAKSWIKFQIDIWLPIKYGMKRGVIEIKYFFLINEAKYERWLLGLERQLGRNQ